jgi:ATP-dependent Clp protease ATP-binding subunit ClpB
MDFMTSLTQKILQKAYELALEKSQTQIEIEHFLWNAFKDPDAGLHLLFPPRSQNKLLKIQHDLALKLEDYATLSEGSAVEEPKISPSFQKLLVQSQAHAKKYNDQFLSVEIILLTTLEKGSSSLIGLLQKHGVDIQSVERLVQELRKKGSVDSQQAESQRGALSKYTQDLTEKALQGKLDPVIGRDDEIRRTLHILLRR